MLVDPRVLSASRYDQAPTADVLSDLDDDMRSVLNRRDLAAEDKVESYNQILMKHRQYYRQHRTPAPHTALTNPPPPPPAASPETPRDDDDVVDTLPQRFKNKGRVLLKRLRHNPDVSWNDRGELIVRGRLVSGSHIADLLNDIARRRKNFEPQGWQAFADVLRESNVPRELVGHPDRWDYIRRGETRVNKRPASETSDKDDERTSQWLSWPKS